MWTLGLEMGSGNMGPSPQRTEVIKLLQDVAMDNKESLSVRKAAAKAFQAMHPSPSDDEAQRAMHNILSNSTGFLSRKGILKPWTWLRSDTPDEIKAVIQNAIDGIPLGIQSPGAEPTEGSAVPNASLPTAQEMSNPESMTMANTTGPMARNNIFPYTVRNQTAPQPAMAG